MGKVDKSTAVEIARVLYNTYKKCGIFYKRPPEEIIPKGISKGSKEHLLFITLTVALDYIRPSEELWEASRKTYKDPKTRYLFYPEKVVEKEQSELKNDMQKYKLALRPKKDPNIWNTLCKTLNSEYNNNPIKLIEKFNYDALELCKHIRAEKSKFPNLSGKKILPLWLRMINHQTEIELKNIDKIPIPVDTHVIRASKMIGIISQNEYKSKNVKEVIQKRWEENLRGEDIYPILLDEPLWILSRYGCSKVKDNKCPQANCCPVKDHCILYKENVGIK